MDEEGRRLVEQLEVAVEHRTTIGMALGLLMERHDMGQDEAFERLRLVSSLLNRKLHDIACELVDTRQLPEVPTTRAGRAGGTEHVS